MTDLPAEEDKEAADRAALLARLELDRPVLGGSPRHLAAIKAGTDHLLMVLWPSEPGPDEIY